MGKARSPGRSREAARLVTVPWRCGIKTIPLFGNGYGALAE
jgi:hypothetical protein